MHQYLATGDYYYTTVLYRSFHELVPGCPLFLLEKRDETGPGWSQCGLAPDENNVVGIRKNKTKKGCSHTPYWSLRYDDRAATCMLHVWPIRTRYIDLRDICTQVQAPMYGGLWSSLDSCGFALLLSPRKDRAAL